MAFEDAILKAEPIDVAIVGPTKSGKTHLLNFIPHAIISGNEARSGPQITIRRSTRLRSGEFAIDPGLLPVDPFDADNIALDVLSGSGAISGTRIYNSCRFTLLRNGRDGKDVHVVDYPGGDLFVNKAKDKDFGLQADNAAQIAAFKVHARRAESFIICCPISVDASVSGARDNLRNAEVLTRFGELLDGNRTIKRVLFALTMAEEYHNIRTRQDLSCTDDGVIKDPFDVLNIQYGPLYARVKNLLDVSASTIACACVSAFGFLSNGFPNKGYDREGKTQMKTEDERYFRASPYNLYESILFAVYGDVLTGIKIDEVKP